MSTGWNFPVGVCLAVFLSVGSTIVSAQPAEEVIHVAAGGGKSGDGTAAAPFPSLEQAQAELRHRIASGLSGNVRIILHPGTY